MSAGLLISCDAFAALFVAPHRAAAPARLGAPEHDPRATATCRHPRLLAETGTAAEGPAPSRARPAPHGATRRTEDAA